MSKWAPYCGFPVYGIPMPQPRPRATIRGKHAGVYDPGTATGWKSQIAIAARAYIPKTPIDAPVKLDISFVFPRPGRLLRKKDLDGRILHTARPDRDNLEKAVMDALTAIGMWRDDALVCDGSPRKFYAAKGELSGAFIQISVFKE
jgi:Holliday junction resolvase RusA-like endonuclease